MTLSSHSFSTRIWETVYTQVKLNDTVVYLSHYSFRRCCELKKLVTRFCPFGNWLRESRRLFDGLHGEGNGSNGDGQTLALLPSVEGTYDGVLGVRTISRLSYSTDSCLVCGLSIGCGSSLGGTYGRDE